LPSIKEHDPENRLQLLRKNHAQLITKIEDDVSRRRHPLAASSDRVRRRLSER
jgi:hypothetical protein